MVFDPRNPSGEPRIEIGRTHMAPPPVSKPFDPRNPSGEDRNNPVVLKPRLVNDTPFSGEAKYNLFINYYIDKNIERQKELVKCVIENAKNFDTIFVIADFESFEDIQGLVNFELTPIITDGKRTTWLEYFDLISICNAPNNINIIANLDIVIPKETLANCIPYFKTESKRVLALTRWDINADGSNTFFNRADSQDVWIFNGAVEKGIDAPFGLGLPGTDNAIAHRLHVIGYEVLNPSLSLKTYHQHLVMVRNYLNEKGEQKERGIAPPYKILVPSN